MSAPGCAARRSQESEDPTTPDTSPADKHYDVAVGSFHNGMFEDAKLQLDRALRADPDHADSYYLRGLLLLNEGRTMVDAVESDQCLTDDASDLQRRRAEQLHAQARESFVAAAEHYPEGAAGRGRAQNSLAVVDLFFHDHEGAIEDSRAALEQRFYADRYSALANLGWAYYNLGDLVSATNELRQAVLLNPDFCVARYRLAQVYLDTDQLEAALEQAQQVVEDPRCPIQDAHRIAGVARLRLGDEAGAREAFGTCVSLAPRSCLARDCSRFLGTDDSAGDAIARSAP
ncbi:MAG: tetratricopeptide repeat protein [Myxococcales bacterium]|nr:tetratricopeptide repeat protein [Myxococcales bacterium]MCB9712860.1 tetratricopeptide repeat protein [Myxococcales bacterium]